MFSELYPTFQIQPTRFISVSAMSNTDFSEHSSSPIIHIKHDIKIYELKSGAKQPICVYLQKTKIQQHAYLLNSTAVFLVIFAAVMGRRAVEGVRE